MLWFKKKNIFKSHVEKYNSIGNNIVVDENFNIVYIDKNTLSIFDYSNKEILGKHINILLPEESKTRHFKHLKKFDWDYKYQNEFMNLKKQIFGNTKYNQRIALYNLSLTNLIIEKSKYILVTFQDICNDDTLINNIKQYQIFFTLSQDLTCIVNEDGYFVKVNQSFITNLEYSYSELYEKPFMKFVYPSDLKITEKEFQKILLGENINSFRNRFVTKSNNVIWLTWTAFKHNNLIYAIARNDTVTNYIEKAITSSQICIVTLDKNLKINYHNSSFNQFLEKEDSAIGLSITEYIPEQNNKEFLEYIESSKKESSHTISTPFFKNDKKTLVYINLTIIYENFSFVCFIQDVSVQREKDLIIEQDEGLWEDCEEMAMIGNFKWNIITQELNWSGGLCNIFGIKQKDVNFNAYKKLLHPDYKKLLDDSIENCINHKKSYSIEHKIITPQGIEKFITAKAKYTIRENNHPYIIGVCQDITKQKNIEKALIKTNTVAEEALKNKSLFLANMSHEIRTPLNGIIGMASLLVETNLDVEQKEYIDTIVNSSGILLSIIHNILEQSKIELGSMTIDSNNFNIRNVFQNINNLYLPLCKSKNLFYTIGIDPDIPDIIRGDEIKYQQIIGNLLNNAIKFTEKGGIIINVIKEINNMRITIQDTGIGISEEHQKKLFTPFTQADNTITKLYGGTGLGLSICKSYISLMKGSIELTSQIKQGTKITIILPLDNEADKLVKEIQENKKQLAISLVEDNSINQIIFVKMIKKIGDYKVNIYCNGQEAVDNITEDNTAIIFMDLHMPILDGFQSTKQLREKKIGVPIIALTANAMNGIEKLCVDVGMNEYTLKPIQLNTVRSIIDKYVKDL